MVRPAWSFHCTQYGLDLKGGGKGRGGREGGRERERKEVRRAEAEVLHRALCPGRLLSSTPTTETAGQRGPRAVAPPRPGSAGGRCPWVSQEEGGWGKGRQEKPFLSRLSAAAPLETSLNLSSLQAQRQRVRAQRSGRGQEKDCFQLAGTQNSGPTTYRWQHKATPVAHTVCGPGEHLGQTDVQEKDDFAALEKG